MDSKLFNKLKAAALSSDSQLNARSLEQFLEIAIGFVPKEKLQALAVECSQVNEQVKIDDWLGEPNIRIDVGDRLSIKTKQHPDGHGANGTMSTLNDDIFATVSVHLNPDQIISGDQTMVAVQLSSLFSTFDYDKARVEIEIGCDAN